MNASIPGSLTITICSAIAGLALVLAVAFYVWCLCKMAARPTPHPQPVNPPNGTQNPPTFSQQEDPQ